MKISVSNFLLPLTGLSFLAALPAGAQIAAAPAPVVPPAAPQLQTPAPEPARMHAIRLKWVAPSLMAWWIDPKNQPEPTVFNPNGARPSRDNVPEFKMPEGVKRIVAIDPQNSLLVSATDAGFAQVRDFVEFLDKPQGQTRVIVNARLLTIKTANLSDIWAALSTQTGRATPALAFLKPDESLALGEQILRREAKLERTIDLTIDGAGDKALDFGPVSFAPIRPDFESAMPVIPPPETGDMRVWGRSQIRRLLPAPLGTLRFSVGARAATSETAFLQLREIDLNRTLGRDRSTEIQLKIGDTAALALPESLPGTNAFLLLEARAEIVLTARLIPNRPPLLGDLPLIGELFRLPKQPQTAP